MTVDEELGLLDDAVRRLKIEYDVFFGGGSKRPPVESEWHVQALVKKYSDTQKLSFAQRFKYNSILQRYAIYSDLWRQKLKIKEEGYRRPQDAVLGIQGMRHEEEQAAAEALSAGTAAAQEPFSVVCSNADAETDKVRALYDVMMRTKKETGEVVARTGSFESFHAFVKRKTEQIRSDFGCQAVEYSIEVQDGQVRLKAKAKV